MSASSQIISLLMEINKKLDKQNELLENMVEVQTQEALQSMMWLNSLLGNKQSKTEAAMERYLSQGLVKENEPGAKEMLEELSAKRKRGFGDLLG